MGDEAKSLREILQYAIAKEGVARAMYANAAEEVKDPSARRLLADLAQAEGRHEKALQDLDASRIPEKAPEDISDLRIAEFLEDVELDAHADLQTVLVYAMKREQKSRDFYEAMANEWQDPEAKKLFATLAAQEQEHKRVLETIYDDEILAQD